MNLSLCPVYVTSSSASCPQANRFQELSVVSLRHCCTGRKGPMIARAGGRSCPDSKALLGVLRCDLRACPVPVVSRRHMLRQVLAIWREVNPSCGLIIFMSVKLELLKCLSKTCTVLYLYVSGCHPKKSSWHATKLSKLWTTRGEKVIEVPATGTDRLVDLFSLPKRDTR